MPKAIETKFLPCTYSKGSRIKAYAEGGNQATIGYPHEGSNSHRLACEALTKKMGWEDADWIEGGKADGKGSVFVQLATRFYIAKVNELEAQVLLKFAEAHDLPNMAHNCRKRLAQLGN